MNTQNLETNLIAVLQESQIKLGYESRETKLYYPLAALNGLLETEYDVQEMMAALKNFCGTVKEMLGEIEVTEAQERFCLIIPSQGADHIHAYMQEHAEDTEFLRRFIEMVRGHGCTIGKLKELFEEYSDKVYFEKMQNAEFDYLLYFKDGKPDAFRYCIQEEDCHMIYHRFTENDYLRIVEG